MNDARNVFRELRFTMGAASLRQLPADRGAEVAFGGRSNSGKSTAINVVAGRRALARTSKTPGRTQQINFFDLDQGRRIVDLPGYGFAKAPRGAQDAWGRLVEGYLGTRQSLAGLVLLVDVRRPLTDLDRRMVSWCEHAGLALHLVLTKADKVSRSQAVRALSQTRGELEALRIPCSSQLFSALKREGLDALLERLLEWLDVTQASAPEEVESAAKAGLRGRDASQG